MSPTAGATSPTCLHRRARLGLGRTYQQRACSASSRPPSRWRSRCSVTAWFVPNASAGTERRLRDACQILERLEIADYADRPVAQLPTGIRVAELACVIALEPDVLLLDEPTAGSRHGDGVVPRRRA